MNLVKELLRLEEGKVEIPSFVLIKVEKSRNPAFFKMDKDDKAGAINADSEDLDEDWYENNAFTWTQEVATVEGASLMNNDTELKIWLADTALDLPDDADEDQIADEVADLTEQFQRAFNNWLSDFDTREYAKLLMTN